jgi:hypothetical protein
MAQNIEVKLSASDIKGMLRNVLMRRLKSRSAQSHLSSFCSSSWAGCVLGFWWLPLYELHVYSSMWSEAEALSEYGVVP